jgi:hypothetical protein
MSSDMYAFFFANKTQTTIPFPTPVAARVLSRFLGFGILLLDDRQLESLADPPGHLLPQGEIDVLVPREDADPWLDVVVDVQRHVVGLGDLAGGVGDLVLGLLVLERQLAAVRIYALAGGAPAQLLERGGADVGQVVGARARDDGVPDDGLVGLVHGVEAGRRRGPLGRYVDEELLRVPGEQRRQVRVERELDYGILLLL